MRVLYLTVHMGGGAGKAIAGMIPPGPSADSYEILSLERPEKPAYMKEAAAYGARVVVEPSESEIREAVGRADVVVLNWWGHPLLMRNLSVLGQIPCRLALWAHINGCVYPYLPYSFITQFDKAVFTTPYSLKNPLWTQAQRAEAETKGDVVYGIGRFNPSSCRKKTDYAVRDGCVSVGYMGTISYGKMHPRILSYYERAFERMAGQEIEYRFVGEADPRFLQEASESRIGKRTLFTGYCHEVEAELLHMDVFSYLVSGESYGTTENALLEAMAAGLPVIASRCGSMEEIIRDGENGYLAGDEEEYGRKLQSLCEHEEERKRLGENARRFVVSRYDGERNRSHMTELCRQMLREDKRIHDLRSTIGARPLEQFLYFASHDGAVFTDYLNQRTEEAAIKVRSCKPIFRERSKASIRQFAAYYPDSAGLQELNTII